MRGAVSAALQGLIWAMLMWTGMAGCGGSSLVSSVDSVNPTIVSDRMAMDLWIHGRFLTQVSVSAQSGDVDVRDVFSARLELISPSGEEGQAGDTVELEAVTYVDGQNLTARTPAHMPAGTYRLAVEDPRGRWAEVPDAVRIEVENRSPDHVELLPAKGSLTVGDKLPITLQAVDVDGNTFPWAGFVKVKLGSSNASFTYHNLTGADESTSDGLPMLSGWLDKDGEALIEVTDAVLEDFTIQVESVGLPHDGGEEGITIQGVPVEFAGFDVQLIDAIPDGSGIYDVVAGYPFEVSVTAVNPAGEALTGGDVDFDFELVDSSFAPVKYYPLDPLVLTAGSWTGLVTLFDASEAGHYDLVIAVGPDQKGGSSPPVRVQPGTPRSIDVQLSLPDEDGLEAGETFSFVAQQTDAYANPVDVPDDAIITAEDLTDTLLCSTTEVDGSRVAFDGCSITGVREDDTITVWIGGVQGRSTTFDVSASSLVGLAFVLPADPVTAGAEFVAELRAADRYGNQVTGVDGTATVVDVPTGSEPELTGTLNVTLVDGRVDIPITLFHAVSSTYLRADSSDLGLEGGSDSFQVRWAPVSAFTVAVDQLAVYAGEETPAVLVATDAYGNVVKDYEPTELTLSDSTLSMEADDYEIGAFIDGMAEAMFIVTIAAPEVTLSAADGEEITGTSDPFAVLPGPMARILIIDGEPVHFLNDPFTLELQVVDEFGNVVTSFGNTVRLFDETGTLGWSGSSEIGTIDVGPFQQGVYTGQFTISKTTADDHLHAYYAGIAGTSAAFPVYDLSCASAPSVALTLNDDPEQDYAVSCLPLRPGANASVSMTATAQSDLAIIDYVWFFGDGESKHNGQLSQLSHSYTTAGRFPVRVAVVDSALCAGSAEGTVYVGEDDGSPAGMLDVVAAPGTVVAGATDGSQLATVTVQAYDCSGDVASGNHQLTVQSSLGQVILPAGDANTSSQGLQLALDKKNGTAQFTLSVANVLEGDWARVLLMYGEGQAIGGTAVTVNTDRKPPIVVEYSPRGLQYGTVNEITVGFNETLRTRNGAIDKAPILVESQLEGPLEFTRRLEDDDATLILTLVTPIDLDAQPDIIRVTLPSQKSGYSITDDPDGNRLDGNWDGTSQDEDSFVFYFGNLGVETSTGAVTGCSVSEPVFSPDGQSGLADGEADYTQVSGTVSASLGLRAFAIEIRDELDEYPIAWLWTPVEDDPKDPAPYATEAKMEVIWNGTGLDGQILPNGIYPFAIWTVDVNDNWLGASCTDAKGDDRVIELHNPVDLGAYP